MVSPVSREIRVSLDRRVMLVLLAHRDPLELLDLRYFYYLLILWSLFENVTETLPNMTAALSTLHYHLYISTVCPC